MEQHPAIEESSIEPAEIRVRGRRSGVNPQQHAVGDPVELHTKFDDSWCSGFRVAEVLTDGYLVRRSHDLQLLPGPTSDDDLRAAPSSSR